MSSMKSLHLFMYYWLRIVLTYRKINDTFLIFFFFWQGPKESVTVKSLIMTVMMELVLFQVLLSKFTLLHSVKIFHIYNLLL